MERGVGGGGGGGGGRKRGESTFVIGNLIRLSKVYIPCNDKVSFPDKKCVGTYFGSV